MRYFSFDFLGFLSLLAFIFFRPAFYLRPRARTGPNLRSQAYLRPRGWKSTVSMPAIGGLTTLGAPALHARRRRLMLDARLQMS